MGFILFKPSRGSGIRPYEHVKESQGLGEFIIWPELAAWCTAGIHVAGMND